MLSCVDGTLEEERNQAAVQSKATLFRKRRVHGTA